MPLPKPKQNEKQNEFMQRCVVDPITRKEYTDKKQRIAVCYDIYKRN